MGGRPAFGLAHSSSQIFTRAATNRDVELPFVAFYRFDEKGRLTSERVVMNLGPLRARD